MDDWANISDDEDIDDGDDEEEDDEKTKDGEQIYLLDWSKLVQCSLVQDGILVLRKAHTCSALSQEIPWRSLWDSLIGSGTFSTF